MNKLIQGAACALALIIMSSSASAGVFADPAYDAILDLDLGLNTVTLNNGGACEWEDLGEARIHCRDDNRYRFYVALAEGTTLTNIEVALTRYLGPAGLSLQFAVLEPPYTTVNLTGLGSELFAYDMVEGPVTAGYFRTLLREISGAEEGVNYRYTAQWTFNVVETASDVPAPQGITLFGFGLMGLGFARWRQKKVRA